MTDRIDEIEARMKATTPGPWEADIVGDSCETRIHLTLIGQPPSDGFSGHNVIATLNGFGDDKSDEERAANLLFIADAHQDVPWLLARVRQLEKWIQKYGEHGDECMAGSNARDWRCSCGLNALVGR